MKSWHQDMFKTVIDVAFCCCCCLKGKMHLRPLKDQEGTGKLDQVRE